MKDNIYRGRRPDGIWVEGYYFAKPILNKHYILCGENQWLVEPETVGQYSGLDDKNGERVFEGDLIQSKGNLVWLVSFERSAFVCKDATGRTYFALWEQWEYDLKNNKPISPSEYFEVVGNVFDNPELLT